MGGSRPEWKGTGSTAIEAGGAGDDFEPPDPTLLKASVANQEALWGCWKPNRRIAAQTSRAWEQRHVLLLQRSHPWLVTGPQERHPTRRYQATMGPELPIVN